MKKLSALILAAAIAPVFALSSVAFAGDRDDDLHGSEERTGQEGAGMQQDRDDQEGAGMERDDQERTGEERDDDLYGDEDRDDDLYDDEDDDDLYEDDDDLHDDDQQSEEIQ